MSLVPRERLVTLVTSLALLGLPVGCGDDAPEPRPNGEQCSSGGQCQSGLCHTSVCLEPASDDDGDGLINSVEAQLGTSALLADTDGDGLSDLEEVAEPADPAHPHNDTDQDGTIDALESAYEDGDCDGVGDQFDHPGDPAPEDAPDWVVCPSQKFGDCCTDGDVDGVADVIDCDPSRPEIHDGETCAAEAAKLCMTGTCSGASVGCEMTSICVAQDACETATCELAEGGSEGECVLAPVACEEDETPCTEALCDPEAGCLQEALPTGTFTEKVVAHAAGCLEDPCLAVAPLDVQTAAQAFCVGACADAANCGLSDDPGCVGSCTSEVNDNVFTATKRSCVEAHVLDGQCASPTQVEATCGLADDCPSIPGPDVLALCEELIACDASLFQSTYPKLASLPVKAPLCAAILEGRRLAGGTPAAEIACMIAAHEAASCDLPGISACLSCQGVNCDDGDPCTVDSCDETGACHHVAPPIDDAYSLFSGCWADHLACESVCRRLSPALPGGCHPGTGLAEVLGDYDSCKATCNANHADGSWNVNRLSGCMATYLCGAPDPACTGFEPIEEVTEPCKAICAEIMSPLCPWEGYDQDTCVAWCEGAGLPSKSQYGLGVTSAEVLMQSWTDPAVDYCPDDDGSYAYSHLRNGLMFAHEGCLDVCDGLGACSGWSGSQVHGCTVQCGRESYDEPGVTLALLPCGDTYQQCSLTGAESCCEELEICVPEGAANVCVRACEQAEKYEGTNYAICMATCSQVTQESSGEFARRYCQASAVSAELYAGCSELSDEVLVPEACFDACDPVDPEGPCNALEGFACPLACTGLMSWIVTTGASLETASCYMDLIGPSCDPGKVYSELAADVCP